jgi:hypothetical protein
VFTGAKESADRESGGSLPLLSIVQVRMEIKLGKKHLGKAMFWETFDGR